MSVVRKWGEGHIKKSLKQIDPNTWLLGNYILRRSPNPSNTATWIDKSDGSSYLLEEASTSQSCMTSSPDSPHISLVHEAGDASVVWAIGSDALCKIRYIEKGVTPESVTLNYVQGQQPSFDTPKVLRHIYDKDRSYLFLQRLPGRTLDSAWPSLTEERRTYYVNAIAAKCEEMANWTGCRLSGVDGQDIPEPYLQPNGKEGYDTIQDTCQAIGMDCSSFVFFHADLGPSNIMVADDPRSGRLGIIDFEISGFFPRGWVRTKFRISPGLDLSSAVTDTSPTYWRSEVQKALEKKGFEDYSEGYMNWLQKGPSDGN
jgi:aminoglycoside phosphotransferase